MVCSLKKFKSTDNIIACIVSCYLSYNKFVATAVLKLYTCNVPIFLSICSCFQISKFFQLIVTGFLSLKAICLCCMINPFPLFSFLSLSFYWPSWCHSDFMLVLWHLRKYLLGLQFRHIVVPSLSSKCRRHCNKWQSFFCICFLNTVYTTENSNRWSAMGQFMIVVGEKEMQ